MSEEAKRSRIADELRKAGRAKEVLENEAFTEAVNQVEQALLHGMRQAGMADDKLRLNLLARYELLHSLLDVLRSTVETGQFAQKELEEMEKQNIYQRALKAVGWN